MTVVLKGDKRRPSGQGPGARVFYGLSSHELSGITGSPRPCSQPGPPREAGSALPAGDRHPGGGRRPPARRSRGATRRARTRAPAAPRSGSDPRLAAARSPALNSQGRGTAPGELGFLSKPKQVIQPITGIQAGLPQLPPAPGPATHSVDVAAYADTELAGHRITWTDARTPSVGGDYLFAPGTSIRDGRTARVYGGVATTPADGGVGLFAGGTVGVVPTTGVVFRLLAPDGRVVHELVTLPDSAFVAAPPVRVWANGDLTRAFVLNGAVLPKGTGRLRLLWMREPDPDLPRLSAAESATVALHLR